MKYELTLRLAGSEVEVDTLSKIRSEGFHGAVITTESIRQAIEYSPNDQHFFGLRHIQKKQALEDVLCVFIVDEKELETLKSVIRRVTDDFRLVSGCMYSHPLEDYEGSF